MPEFRPRNPPRILTAIALCAVLQLSGVPFMLAFGGRLEGLAEGNRAMAEFVLSLVALNLVLLIGNRGDPGLVGRIAPGRIRLLEGRLLGLVLAAAAGFALTNLAIVGNLAANVPFIREMGEKFSVPFTEAPPLALLLFVGLANPVFEELFFRAYLAPGLARRYGQGFAIMFVALLFGAVHINPTQVVSAGLLGLFLNYLVLRTGNVYYTIACHCAFNVFLMFAGLLPEPGALPNLNPFHPAVGLTLTPLDLAGLAVLILAIRRIHALTRPAGAAPEPGAQ